MGGHGSGLKFGAVPKQIVEDSLILDIKTLAGIGAIRESDARGSLSWQSNRSGKQIATVDYTYCKGGGLWTLTLRYSICSGDEESNKIQLPITLQTTVPHFGGRRLWFTCPLVIDNVPCSRRTAKLYLPPGKLYFGCRHCHCLTYTSCRDSHKYDRLFHSLAHDVGWAPDKVKDFFTHR